MRYFFLAYAIIAILVVGIFGFRGQKFSKPPLRIFSDMKEQDKLKAQKPDAFFADGIGARKPVTQTQPRGFIEDGQTTLGGIPEAEFGGGTGYYFTGHVGDYFGNGMPDELALTAENAPALLRRGEERFGIYCAPCHGKSGDGNGITSQYGVPGIANLHTLKPETYPNGRVFETISKGKGNMSGYAYNIPVRDRWAIIAYIRALQVAKEAPYDAVKTAFDAGLQNQTSAH
jgi:mono/diheme cytochrome c family protein